MSVHSLPVPLTDQLRAVHRGLPGAHNMWDKVTLDFLAAGKLTGLVCGQTVDAANGKIWYDILLDIDGEQAKGEKISTNVVLPRVDSFFVKPYEDTQPK